MVKVTLDPSVTASLHKLQAPAELCDATGRLIGYFHPAVQGSDHGSRPLTSPLPKEEIQRRRQQRTGKTLAEILATLKRS